MSNVISYSVVSGNSGLIPSAALATDCRNLLTRDVLCHRQNCISITFRQRVNLYIMQSRRCLFKDMEYLNSDSEC